MVEKAQKQEWQKFDWEIEIGLYLAHCLGYNVTMLVC